MLPPLSVLSTVPVTDIIRIFAICQLPYATSCSFELRQPIGALKVLNLVTGSTQIWFTVSAAPASREDAKSKQENVTNKVSKVLITAMQTERAVNILHHIATTVTSKCCVLYKSYMYSV